MAARATGFDGDEVARRLEVARSSMALIRRTEGDLAPDYGEFLCPAC